MNWVAVPLSEILPPKDEAWTVVTVVAVGSAVALALTAIAGATELAIRLLCGTPVNRLRSSSPKTRG